MTHCKNMELWWAELPTVPGSHVQHGHRPVVVVSNDFANANSPVVTVVPLTSKTHKVTLPTHVLLCGYGLNCNSIACCEQVMALDKSRIIRRFGQVTGWFDQLAIRHALTVQLNLTA